MAIPIENLIRDQPELTTILPDATLQEAVELMIENDFSQLPIVEDGKPYGTPASFVTSTSIARALLFSPSGGDEKSRLPLNFGRPPHVPARHRPVGPPALAVALQFLRLGHLRQTVS